MGILKMLPEPIAVTLQVTNALEKLDIPYFLGGSFASAVLGIINVQADLLDLDYLRNWAIQLGVIDLLEKAL